MAESEDTSYVISDYLLSKGYSVPDVLTATGSAPGLENTYFVTVDPRGRACEFTAFESSVNEPVVRKQIVAQGSLGDNFTKVYSLCFYWFSLLIKFYQIAQIIDMGGKLDSLECQTNLETPSFTLPKIKVVQYNIDQAATLKILAEPIREKINPNHLIEAIEWTVRKKPEFAQACSFCQTWDKKLVLTGLDEKEAIVAYKNYLEQVMSYVDVNPYTAKQIARSLPWTALKPSGYSGVDWTRTRIVDNVKFSLPIYICAKIRFLLTFSSPTLAVYYVSAGTSNFWAEEVTDIENDAYAKTIPGINKITQEANLGTLDFLLPRLAQSLPSECQAHRDLLSRFFDEADHKDLFFVHNIAFRMVQRYWSGHITFSKEELMEMDVIETNLDLIGFNTWLSDAKNICKFEKDGAVVLLNMNSPHPLYPANFKRAVRDAARGVFTWECVLSNMNQEAVSSERKVKCLIDSSNSTIICCSTGGQN